MVWLLLADARRASDHCREALARSGRRHDAMLEENCQNQTRSRHSGLRRGGQVIDQAIRDKVLHHYPLLRELSGETLDALVAGATYMTVPPGATMYDDTQKCMGFAC